jgi:hypothetical protein
MTYKQQINDISKDIETSRNPCDHIAFELFSAGEQNAIDTLKEKGQWDIKYNEPEAGAEANFYALWAGSIGELLSEYSPEVQEYFHKHEIFA